MNYQKSHRATMAISTTVLALRASVNQISLLDETTNSVHGHGFGPGVIAWNERPLNLKALRTWAIVVGCTERWRTGFCS
jgi:hypothetical protein